MTRTNNSISDVDTKLDIPSLITMYERGENISAYMRKTMSLDHNTREIIETAYDLQAGSYSSAMKNSEYRHNKKQYAHALARKIQSLCNPQTILEAGVGEATTLSEVLNVLDPRIRSYGFDLSWSRAAYARKWLLDHGHLESMICTGDLLNIPFQDNAIDIVYTSHSIEPNRGREEPILQELYRITNKYLILLEPGYEFGDEEARQRMDYHCYCKNLNSISRSLGFNVIEHTLFPHSANPLNPTAMIVIRKDTHTQTDMTNNPFACPKSKTPLKVIDGTMYCPTCMTAYQIIGGIPCLRAENGILASKFEIMMNVAHGITE